jgi:FSR family fosmidomycin resistance protein-like MFS transporter
MVVDTTQPDAVPKITDQPDRRGLSLLGAGHFVVDMTVGALSPLLPVFKKAMALSDLRTSLVLAALTFSSSFIQPLFGVVADRVRATWFLWGGVAMASIGLALSGLVTSFWVLLTLIVLCGLGVGGYHPEAARVANQMAGARKASGVAWFTIGGNLGFAIGPLLVALFVPLLDERTTLVFLVPGAVACALLLANHGRVALPIIASHTTLETPGRTDMRGMVLLVSAVSLRTWIQLGLMVIVPLYLSDERGLSAREVGFVIFAFVMTGSIGTYVGAAVADRIGGRAMFVGSMPLAAPLVATFILTDGAASIVAFAAAGFILMASYSTTVVMGQQYMPHRPALAAAWVLGFAAIGAATPWLPVIGAIADSAGRETALWILAAIPLASTAIAAFLPHPDRIHRPVSGTSRRIGSTPPGTGT